ncbi:MAG: HD domain-containing protein [Candidatus Thermoplasmatota archaeon]|nr:HD domain-containing protein [Candidatus Thermoplasmatota archaeon]
MKDYLELFERIGRLKSTDREGWKRVGIEDVESVADHSFRSAFIGLVLGERSGLDTDKIVKMLLLHDLAEVETGDITPHEGISKKEKRALEKGALEDLFDPIEEKEGLIELWDEFETGQSMEAKVARDIDTLEMILQAVEYQEEYPEKDLSEFIEEKEKGFETSQIENLVENLTYG